MGSRLDLTLKSVSGAGAFDQMRMQNNIRRCTNSTACKLCCFACVSIRQCHSMAERTVLVHVRNRIRPLKFSGSQSDLLSAIRGTFRDVLTGNEELFLQVRLYC